MAIDASERRPSRAPLLVVGDHDDALDGLRGIAALMVVFYHCGVELAWPPIFVPGFTGVHLFFVLSGYLIARPFLARLVNDRPLPDWRAYAVRRFVRIYPTYLVALAVFIAMRLASHLHAPSAGDMLRHALLVFNWGPPKEFKTINIVMWTLAIEAQFYVILPLVIALAHRIAPARGRAAAAAAVLAFFAVGLASRCAEYRATVGADERFRLPFSFLDLFAAGVAVAYLELTRAAWLRARLRLRGALCVFGIASLLACNYWLVAEHADWLNPPTLSLVELYPLGICCGFGAILLAVRTRGSDAVPVLTGRPLTFIGKISYSMYLYHVGVGYLILARLPHGAGRWLGMHPKAYALAQLGPVILFSYLAYRAVELPSLRWLERFSERRRGAKALGAT